MERGAKAVYGYCTHPVLSGKAIQRIESSCLQEVVVTNTIPLPAGCTSSKIRVLSVASLLGEAIIRIHMDMSVSELFR